MKPAASITQPHPDAAWQDLINGNARFVAGRALHPGQDAARRAELRDGQRPHTLVFGCSDSRVAAEIIFDQGLGDLFVVRTAGHVVDTGVLGSVEFAVRVMQVPLVVVLGHDQCGAVAAAVQAVRTGTAPPGYIRDVTERITPVGALGPTGATPAQHRVDHRTDRRHRGRTRPRHRETAGREVPDPGPGHQHRSVPGAGARPTNSPMVGSS